ncbi:penicillin acylase family protein [Cereibacter azotoformans]|uniref:Penicillin amidase n=1 Tax=Cereibacter azotoformans TaxID=43057 RepID=A0A2T5KD28_9RHOB|nr:penicillin acylase family protein [Cereibacter azotoformans]AXQ93525.1 penicillin acylase family protein [Cereibacter sphaeroides]MBO4168711.1 penicillin acylase family protein [Cereibacter azotoformans]PTR20297.1 penicillin amidase [Cereibacter azotoformans]UIJ31861.1 penicillin acylase family protein [Cereibacter azotoformans]
MIVVFRWLLRIFTGLVVLALVAVLITYYFLSRSLPDYNESFRLEGVSGPVEIVRNDSNVPHIFGPTDEDVYFALGFAHAQDRLWQMVTMRRTAQGRLSEVFGERTLKIDELMRRYDLYGLAQASVEVQDPEVLAALEAYSRGVNAWIGQVNADARGRGAPEFFLFSNEIAVWRPADSIALIKLMALQLSSHLQSEVLRARVSLLLPDARVSDILPDAPGEGVIALPSYASLVPGPFPALRKVGLGEDPLSPFHPKALSGASNAWAAAPSRSAAGGSLLANDPHLAFTAPSIWYLARLQLASGGVIGATLPGIPAVLLGRSNRLGWALTSAYMDDQDVHIEELNPDNREEYRTPEGWKRFETRRSIINVKDARPITVTLRWTDNGPVLPGTHYDLAAITPPGHVASLSWTALSDQDTSISAAMRLMKARTVEEAIEAGRLFVAPAQNLMLADVNGVAMQTVGAMPRRDPAHQSRGRIPSPGWIAENLWQGVFPYEDNPRMVDPSTGILGNTNNKTVDQPFPRHVSFDWGDTQRIQRWLALMKSREVHTRESFIEAQLDTVSPTARNLLPLVAADLWFTGEAAPEGTPERLRQRALTLLAEWNGEMNEHLPEPLIYMAWMRALQDRLIRDELGPLADEFNHLQPDFVERVYRDVEGAAVWCDIIQSAAVESCTDIARMALDDALIRLTEDRGPNIESWRWGDAHQATHDHPALGEVPLLRYFVNIRQSTSGGDQTLMRGMTRGTGRNPYENVAGAGYRGVYDFADPDSSVFISSTGQSGHPLSRFYDNLGELWRRGEYIPMSLDPALARAAAVGITRLDPLDD